MARASDQPLARRWSPWHDRLHRLLLRDPSLLPPGERLVVAVSGGQDSMALTALLIGLQRLHHWSLHLWHGDHGWHQGSAAIALGLETWSNTNGLALSIDRTTRAATGSEAAARDWRYGQLAQVAEQQQQADPGTPCRRVVCAHTATDRAETLLLNLARGSDLQGLSSLRRARPLAQASGHDLQLVRPLLDISRSDTAAICTTLQLPVWLDPSHDDLDYSRNRIRHQVLPVLNALHPGCEPRMAALSERIEQTQTSRTALLDLGLDSLRDAGGLNRRRLASLPSDLRRSLLGHWLQTQGTPALSSRQLEDLATATAAGAPAGGRDLGGDRRIHWDKYAVQLVKKH